MKLILLGIILLSNILYCYSQQEKDTIYSKTNPIVYSELFMGFAGGNGIGVVIGGELNYQIKKDLFTVKYGYQSLAELTGTAVGFIGFPAFEKTIDNHEISLLYGQRYIKDGHSFSFSGGISTNYADVKQPNNTMTTEESIQYFGFPFEANIKWFKKKKRRFRAYYGLIPIGKPSSFGRSFGFKLVGNIGKFTYVGMGINYGFGWHKKYQQ
ncbi:hypothetical protein [Sediminibacter sp. Hel_I_10]|uniref:hypothetical protein n=1 Tax=Sediminibacter sp. Hel_I_10 TaxID=1392490 RepID=UPI0005690643|nr:hypothetical protein [Sediminibacter sp. Hel_I_10]